MGGTHSSPKHLQSIFSRHLMWGLIETSVVVPLPDVAHHSYNHKHYPQGVYQPILSHVDLMLML